MKIQFLYVFVVLATVGFVYGVTVDNFSFEDDGVLDLKQA